MNNTTAPVIPEGHLYTTVKETTDPRGGVVAIFYGCNDEGDEPGYWVESHRCEFYSDYVSQEEADQLYEYYAHQSQRYN